MQMWVKTAAFMTMSAMIVSGCSKSETAADAGPAIAVSSTDVQSGLVVFSEDADMVTAMFNIGALKVKAPACARTKAVGSFLEANYKDWLSAQGYGEAATLELDMVEILSYDEYNKAKDVKAYGRYTVSPTASGAKAVLSDSEC